MSSVKVSKCDCQCVSALISLDLGFLADLDLPVTRLVLVLLRRRLEIHVSFSIKHDL